MKRRPRRTVRTKFRRLRDLLKANDYTFEDVAQRLHVSLGTISARFQGRSPWLLDEQYRVMDMLGVDYEDMYLLFPPDGDDSKVHNRNIDAVNDYFIETGTQPVPTATIEALAALVSGLERPQAPACEVFSRYQ